MRHTLKRINLADSPFFNAQDRDKAVIIKKQKPLLQLPPMNVAPPGQCCDGTGWYLYDVPHNHPLFSVLQKCQCGRAGNPDTKLTNLQNDLKAYRHCTFDQWDLERNFDQFTYNGIQLNPASQMSTIQIATRRAKAYAETPQGWLYVYGAVGAGKTHLAAAIGHELAKSGRTVIYRNVPELLDNLRSAIGNNNLEYIIDKFISADLLILDDMGAEEMTSDFMSARMFRIFDERMDKRMIITSNLDLNDLQSRVGGRIGSRLLQSSKIYLPLSDFRKYKRKDI